MNQRPARTEGSLGIGARSFGPGLDNDYDEFWPEPSGELERGYELELDRLPQDARHIQPQSTSLSNMPMLRQSSNSSLPWSLHGPPGCSSLDSLTQINPRLNPPFPDYRPLDSPTFDGTDDSRQSYTPVAHIDTTTPRAASQNSLNRWPHSRPSKSSSTTSHNPSSSTFVDLTSDSPVTPSTRHQTTMLKNQTRKTPPSSPRPIKKQKLEAAEIEAVDLQDIESDTDLARVLEKQRVNTIKAQQDAADKPTKLANLTCVVCMEEMTDMTATHCGTSSLP